jgi:4-hydroxybenzoate polyprenyltransferase
MWLKQLRVHQWVKNLFVFAPIIFAHAVTDTGALIASLLAVAAMCFASSGVYLLNDWRDCARDAQRSRTSARPYAAGLITTRSLIMVLVICVVTALVMAFAINVSTGCVVLGYLALNVLYSLWLKRLAVIDVCCIALGFFLRVLVGSMATAIPISPWLFATVFALALALALGKRFGELLACNRSDDTLHEMYSELFLRQAHLVFISLAVALYALWVLEAGVSQTLMVYTIPLVLIAMLFYLLAFSNGEGEGDPTDILYRSRGLQMSLVCYIAVVLMQYVL